MNRKVVLHGPSTLTISLPTKWIKTHGVQKGDELDVKESGNALLISTNKQYTPSKKIKADFRGLSESGIKSLISILHKSGYDEIDVQFSDPKTVKYIQDIILEMLIGFEIITHSKQEAHVKSISSNEFQEFNNVVRRTFLVSTSLAKGSFELISEGKYDELEELLSLEKTNNRLTNFCHRILNKQTVKTEKSSYYYTILWNIECICDDFKYLINFLISKEDPKVDEPTLKLYGEIIDLFEKYYSLFYKYNSMKMDEMKQQGEKLKLELQKKIKEESGSSTVISLYLFNVAQRIVDMLGSTSGLSF